MNKQRLRAIAEWLEGGAKHADVKLDMAVSLIPYDSENETHNQCGTTCCIAGAAVQFFDPNVVADYNMYGTELPWRHIKSLATQLLGLSEIQAEELFVPPICAKGNGKETLRSYNDPAWAARVVRNLLKTGYVDWAAMEHAA